MSLLGTAVSLKKGMLTFHEYFVAALADIGQQGDHEQEDRDLHQHRRQRTGQEDRPVAARDQQRPAQIFFHQRPEHHSEQ